jgi:plasmid stabilization system protein ParE
MKEYDIVFLPAANQDLEEIADYLAGYYESTVTKFRAALLKKIESIRRNPYICQKSRYSDKYRRAIINDYVLYYAIDEDKNLITVYLVIHVSRDVERYLVRLNIFT